MKVILQQDVKGQGKKGQLVEVSDGYARNFLLPKKLAVEANNQNLTVMKSQQNAVQHHKEQEQKKAEDLKDKLSLINVEVLAKAGAGGKLFGSVTSKEIAEQLLKDFNIEIDKRKIVLVDPIKHFGTYTLSVKLHPSVTAQLKVTIKE